MKAFDSQKRPYLHGGFASRPPDWMVKERRGRDQRHLRRSGCGEHDQQNATRPEFFHSILPIEILGSAYTPCQRTKFPLRAVDLFYRIVLMNRSRQPTLSRGLELSALLAVMRLGDDAYGLEVRRELIERSGRDYAVGAIYTTLQRLEDKGFLKSHSSEPLPVRGGRSRRHFTLTGAGQRALRDAERTAATMWSGVGAILRPRTP